MPSERKRKYKFQLEVMNNGTFGTSTKFFYSNNGILWLSEDETQTLEKSLGKAFCKKYIGSIYLGAATLSKDHLGYGWFDFLDFVF